MRALAACLAGVSSYARFPPIPSQPFSASKACERSSSSPSSVSTGRSVNTGPWYGGSSTVAEASSSSSSSSSMSGSVRQSILHLSSSRHTSRHSRRLWQCDAAVVHLHVVHLRAPRTMQLATHRPPGARYRMGGGRLRKPCLRSCSGRERPAVDGPPPMVAYRESKPP
jgi:hypothetical protein